MKRPVRVIRGAGLKSKYAPGAGCVSALRLDVVQCADCVQISVRRLVYCAKRENAHVFALYPHAHASRQPRIEMGPNGFKVCKFDFEVRSKELPVTAVAHGM